MHNVNDLMYPKSIIMCVAACDNPLNNKERFGCAIAPLFSSRLWLIEPSNWKNDEVFDGWPAPAAGVHATRVHGKHTLAAPLDSQQ